MNTTFKIISHAYILDQPQNSLFGNTRDGIIIVGPEYENKE